MRRPAATVAIVLAVLALAAASAGVSSCRNYFACDTSFVEPVPVGAETCNDCVQHRCCDFVGTCNGDEACAASVLAAQQCVESGGPANALANEPGCVGDAGVAANPSAKDLYSCMRHTCAASCGLPSCTVSQAVPQIGQRGQCDNCFASNCCGQINACANNRSCVLTVACIAACADIGDVMSHEDPAAVGAQVTQACANQPGRAIDPSTLGPGSLFYDSACARNCFEQFVDYEQGAVLDLSQQAGCLGFEVYLCGLSAGCGSSCGPADAGSDASPTEDAGDAGSNVNADADADADADVSD